MIPRTKYHNKKAEIDGFKFDSKIEAKRYLQLRELEAKGTIESLEIRPKFIIQDKFTTAFGEKIREVAYVGDFKIVYPGGRQVCEDVKGVETEAFRVKWKLVKRRYPEVEFVKVQKVVA